MIALEPDLFYGLATGQITPRAARERAALKGANEIATRVLDAISGAVDYGKLHG